MAKPFDDKLDILIQPEETTSVKFQLSPKTDDDKFEFDPLSGHKSPTKRLHSDLAASKLNEQLPQFAKSLQKAQSDLLDKFRERRPKQPPVIADRNNAENSAGASPNSSSTPKALEPIRHKLFNKSGILSPSSNAKSNKNLASTISKRDLISSANYWEKSQNAKPLFPNLVSNSYQGLPDKYGDLGDLHAETFPILHKNDQNVKSPKIYQDTPTNFLWRNLETPRRKPLRKPRRNRNRNQNRNRNTSRNRSRNRKRPNLSFLKQFHPKPPTKADFARYTSRDPVMWKSIRSVCAIYSKFDKAAKNLSNKRRQFKRYAFKYRGASQKVLLETRDQLLKYRYHRKIFRFWCNDLRMRYYYIAKQLEFIQQFLTTLDDVKVYNRNKTN